MTPRLPLQLAAALSLLLALANAQPARGLDDYRGEPDDYDSSGGSRDDGYGERRDDYKDDDRNDRDRDRYRDDYDSTTRRRDDDEALTDRPGTYVTNRSTNLYAKPSATAPIVATLRPKTIVEVVRVTEQFYEIRPSKAGRKSGYIRRSYADPYTQSRGTLRRFRSGWYRLTSPAVVHSGPDVGSRKVTTLRQGIEVKVVGREGSWYRIESEDGKRPSGYIPVIAADRVPDGRDDRPPH